MVTPCPETQLLRTFAPEPLRRNMIEAIVNKYCDGRVSAVHVVQALDACAAQGRAAECKHLWLKAVHAVQPVPRVLCAWAKTHARDLGARAVSVADLLAA